MSTTRTAIICILARILFKHLASGGGACAADSLPNTFSSVNPLQALGGGTRFTLICISYLSSKFSSKSKMLICITYLPIKFSSKSQWKLVQMKKLSQWKPVPGDEPIGYVDSQKSRQESVQNRFYQRELSKKIGIGRYARSITHLAETNYSIGKDDPNKLPTELLMYPRFNETFL